MEKIEPTDLILISPSELKWGERVYSCIIGKSGVTADKHEGDGGTPIGRFPIRTLYWRSDRVNLPKTVLSSQVLTSKDCWCDDPTHPDYNRHVEAPFEGRHEKLWREDSVYDIIGVLGYNDSPPMAEKGSAIFLHVWREGATYTEGCIALKQSDFLEIIEELTPETAVVVDARFLHHTA